MGKITIGLTSMDSNSPLFTAKETMNIANTAVIAKYVKSEPHIGNREDKEDETEMDEGGLHQVYQKYN